MQIEVSLKMMGKMKRGGRFGAKDRKEEFSLHRIQDQGTNIEIIWF